ncbi:hypothetical protein M9Y10_004109 [Tritrichomonas musculus]|uniref:RING-type domain-containing protein n=1 Tax=Tritrichomonas musculus TaxID=1915356 RepID=A0ABR2JSF0_9EUKA
MSQYKTIISNYNMNGADQVDEQTEPSEDTQDEVCSICSSVRQDQLLSYPLFIYRTKLPFIINKPPIQKVEDAKIAAVDDEIKVEPVFDNGGGESSLASLITRMIRNRSQDQTQTEENGQNEGQNETVTKRCTVENNFIIQFSLCQHPLHPSCVNRSCFKCPIDRSLRNGFLPRLDELPASKICSEGAEVSEESVAQQIKNSISNFIVHFTSSFENSVDKQENMFVELVKSISGLISTYEARLRSLPDCLDLVTQPLPDVLVRVQASREAENRRSVK